MLGFCLGDVIMTPVCRPETVVFSPLMLLPGYAIRAGVEGTIGQAVTVTGTRRARYRGLHKTHLEHVFSATALNLIRLDAWWNGHPLDHTRTSHLTHLKLALAA
jgi:Transposase DDE domain